MDKSQSAVSIFNKYAKEYEQKFMDVGLYQPSLDLFCHSVQKKNAQILEIACGPGNITQYLLKKRPDFKVLGTDLAPNMLERARINNPTATFELMDGREIKKLNKKYDGIVSGFCFPYFTKEEAIQFIKDAAGLLNPKGVIYISTMEDDYSKSGYKKGSQGDEIFMHYHEEGYLTEALKENGFEILHLSRQDFTNHDGSTSVDMMIVAKKK